MWLQVVLPELYPEVSPLCFVTGGGGDGGGSDAAAAAAAAVAQVATAEGGQGTECLFSIVQAALDAVADVNANVDTKSLGIFRDLLGAATAADAAAAAEAAAVAEAAVDEANTAEEQELLLLQFAAMSPLQPSSSWGAPEGREVLGRRYSVSACPATAPSNPSPSNHSILAPSHPVHPIQPYYPRTDRSPSPLGPSSTPSRPDLPLPVPSPQIAFSLSHLPAAVLIPYRSVPHSEGAATVTISLPTASGEQ